MDKPHIVRLLFQPNHESLLLYESYQLIGGACYAYFKGTSFVELAFFAIRSDRRIQGYGKKLMNKLKSIFIHIQANCRRPKLSILLPTGIIWPWDSSESKVFLKK